MKKHNLLFVHIPKNAGTAINGLLLAEDCKHANPWNRRHVPLHFYKEELGEGVFDSLVKFAVVRNPYDHLISCYYSASSDKSKKRPGKRPNFTRLFDSFAEYLEWVIEKPTDIIKRSLAPQTHWLTLNGKVAINKLLRFENLTEEWAAFAKEYDLPTVLPPRNVGTHPTRQECYTPALAKGVYKLYKEDFEQFNYPKTF